MNQRVQEWEQLVRTQHELIDEYLRAVGRGSSPEVLAMLRQILARVTNVVEVMRQLLPHEGER